MSDTIMNTYGRLPVTFTRGSGVRLWDSEGEVYFDALSGIAVTGLGHAHPDVTAAVCQQAGELIHTSNLYHIAKQNALAERLTALSGMDRVFFCNSGAEANEASIKLARLYGHGKSIQNPTIIVAERSFHGRTMATLTATGNRKVQAGFEPLLKGFIRVPYDDIEAIRKVAEHNQEIVAVLVEPVQGEGGIHIPADNYLNELRTLCDEHDWLLMLDEVQTGIARTGKHFAYQQSGITPDVVALAKGLGNGVPIGACMAQGKAAQVLVPGTHGSTFGGNPLACSAALAVLEVIEREQLCSRAQQLGQQLVDGFTQSLAGNDAVVNIRGRGLMFAIELDRPCAELVGLALAAGLLINVTAERVIRLLPPLIMSDSEAAELIERLSAVIIQFLDGQSV